MIESIGFVILLWLISHRLWLFHIQFRIMSMITKIMKFGVSLETQTVTQDYPYSQICIANSVSLIHHY